MRPTNDTNAFQVAPPFWVPPIEVVGASGGGTEEGAILLRFCGPPDPFSTLQSEPFTLKLAPP